MNDLEAAIASRIYDFDIISLLYLLKNMQYSFEEIRFRSHNGICSQAGLIHDITFRQEPMREVVITLNMGLLGAQSPLPSYLRKKMESQDMGGSLPVQFIGFFDHILLRDYLCNIYPEINSHFFPNWELTKSRYLQILNLQSIAVLHWLFQIVFPEIGVKVENSVLTSEIQTRSILLGKTLLGEDAVFGRTTRVPIIGRRVTLFSEEEMTDTQIPWPREIKNRLTGLLFPVLQAAGIDLEIFLVLKSQKRWVRLDAETYLGYDRIRSSEDSYRRVHIFRGHIGGLFRAAEESGEDRTEKKPAVDDSLR
jgi:hypothetical protein